MLSAFILHLKSASRAVESVFTSERTVKVIHVFLNSNDS